MDRNSIIGFALIFLLIVVYGQLTAPSQEELDANQRKRDSIERVQDSLALLAPENQLAEKEQIVPTAALPANDSMRNQQLQATYGPFASSAAGEEKLEVIENEAIKITFTNKGGKIKEVFLKDYQKVLTDADGIESKGELKLMEDEKNHFEYLFPIANIPKGSVSSEDLYFKAKKNGNTIQFTATIDGGRSFEQSYTLAAEGYQLDYNIRMVGLQNVLSGGNSLKLNWETYIDKLEKNTTYERNYSTVYYKTLEDDPTYCSCTSDDEEDVDGEALKWVSHSNQFFSSTLLAESNFSSANLETKIFEEENSDLKFLKSELNIPLQGNDQTFAMKLYVGPNEFERLKAMGSDLEYTIPYGRSIFGTINRWVIRPIFNFLSNFIGSKGIVILMLTLIVKLVLYPLTYKMLYSQSKMGALKPRLAGLKEKHKDDSQAVQMETMKIYREFGVSPLGGCMPVVIQMPIWFALYRFFPASIEFRQASFLWATDLSSYDIAFLLPFHIPAYGSHVSLFTLLWVITTLIYTYYNTKHMEMGANPMMKYMQYLMPVMFIFFFNNFASGLTCYLLFSNVLNIGQNIITKEYIIDKKKIEEELEAYRKKPKKKKAGFQERLEKALNEQKKAQQATAEAKKKKGKK